MPDLKQYLAFDLGASSGRAMLGTLEGECMYLEEVHRFRTPIRDAGDELRWDIQAIEEELRQGYRIARKQAPALRSMSVDSWGLDYVRIDQAGQPLEMPFCYRDPRVNGVMEDAFQRLSKSRLYELTGTQFIPFNTLFQILSDKPDQAVGCHITIADYLNYRFSNRRAIDVSLASTTQMMDIRSFHWSKPLFELFQLNVDLWPEIVPCGTRLGPVSWDAAVTCIASCSHDTACAVAATPALGDKDRWAYISCGTWSLMGVERPSPLLTSEACEAGFTNEVGINNSIRLLKNLAGLWILQECVREWDGAIEWESLIHGASSVKYGGELIDPDDPLFVARGGMEKRITSYLEARGQSMPTSRDVLVRLILESIAQSYRRCCHDLEQVTGNALEIIHLVGGGSRNSLLCQLTANRTGKQVQAGPAEATALGNVLVQAAAMNDLPPGSTIRSIAANSAELKTYHPESIIA